MEGAKAESSRGNDIGLGQHGQFESGAWHVFGPKEKGARFPPIGNVLKLGSWELFLEVTRSAFMQRDRQIERIGRVDLLGVGVFFLQLAEIVEDSRNNLLNSVGW